MKIVNKILAKVFGKEAIVRHIEEINREILLEFEAMEKSRTQADFEFHEKNLRKLDKEYKKAKQLEEAI